MQKYSQKLEIRITTEFYAKNTSQIIAWKELNNEKMKDEKVEIRCFSASQNETTWTKIDYFKHD